MVFVILFKESIEAAEVVGGLGETPLDARSNVSPFAESEVDFLGVFALLPGDSTEEGEDVFGDFVLDCGAVTHSVYVAEGSSDEAQMAVGF